ncbi:MAG: queuosine salvage family protein [Candidatus Micrarchaeaceae archaeon]
MLKEKSADYAFKERLQEAAESIVLMANDVEIDYTSLLDFANAHAFDAMELPKWELPVFPERAEADTIDFLMVGNSINFAYTDFITKRPYESEYRGVAYKGAMGMWASLKRALDAGMPVLDGSFLEGLTLKEASNIFETKSKIPMLQERLEILNETGGVLASKYEGRFHNMFDLSSIDNRAFGKGGLVEILASEFPSFKDDAVAHGISIEFGKRAQLAIAMVYEKFLGLGKPIFPREEEGKFTVFADYELPRALRDAGILKYSSGLAEKVDGGEPIASGRDEEVEIRAATIHAAKLIEEMIKHFNRSSQINQLSLDYMLWKSCMEPGKKTNAHLCITTAY